MKGWGLWCWKVLEGEGRVDEAGVVVGGYVSMCQGLYGVSCMPGASSRMSPN